MAFEQEPTRTPTGIGNVIVTLKDAVATGETEAYQSAAYQIQVALSDGTVTMRRGNLQPYLTHAQITGLLAFMDDLRAQAASEILGEA